jgi:hypothetical protein
MEICLPGVLLSGNIFTLETLNSSTFKQVLLSVISGVQSAGRLDIHFTVGTSCERTAPLAE